MVIESLMATGFATPSALAFQNLLTSWESWGRAGEWGQQWGQQWLIGQTLLFALIATRISGLFLALPSVSRMLPMRFRLIAIALFSLILVPGVQQSLPAATHLNPLSEIPIALGREFIFGMIIGGVVQLLMTGIQLAGELIASVSGMQLAQTADPSTGQSVPQLASLFGLLVTTLLFAAGGHRLLIDSMLGSFREFPPMSGGIETDHLRLLVDHLSVGIESGLRVAAPVVGCVLMSNLVVALVSRSVPQLNVLAVGLNINLMAALIVMALTIGSAGLVFQAELGSALEHFAPQPIQAGLR